MGSVAFDKLKYLETLKASGIPESQARAHTEALAQAFADAPDLATRSDLDSRVRQAELRFDARIREAELRLEAKIGPHEPTSSSGSSHLCSRKWR